MKIILLQDEKKLGKKGDIIEASEGYARNYILPKKIGVEASSKNLNDLKLHKAWSRSRQERAEEPSVLYPPKRLQLPARNSMVSRLTRRKSSCRRV